tara:strand:+ start:587 stop:820 length:234 start_codon:yes stop_codon:yes gene_type:complete
MSFNLKSDKRNIQKNYPQKKKKKINNNNDHQEIIDCKSLQIINNNPKKIKCINNNQYLITEKPLNKNFFNKKLINNN